jgi:hypothetical protein
MVIKIPVVKDVNFNEAESIKDLADMYELAWLRNLEARIELEIAITAANGRCIKVIREGE